MIGNWTEHASASLELSDAAQWYEERSEGLGKSFLDAAEKAVESMIERPYAWPLLQIEGCEIEGIRQRFVPGFPFSVVYMVLESHIIILAYAHHSRDPGYWGNRLS